MALRSDTTRRLARWRESTAARFLFAIGFVLAFGTAGYSQIEGWSLWQSLYFTVITITTVGYGDYGVSEAGRVFTLFVMLGGIATASYCFTRVAQFVASQALHPEKRIMRQISRLSGHHIVCGTGQTGLRIIERLEAEGQTVVAIEPDASVVEACRARGLVVLHGDATSDSVLHGAGIERAESLAAVVKSDAVNAMICLSARALAPEIRVIARAEDAASCQKLRRAGAHSVLSPMMYGGDGIAEFMSRPNVAELVYGRHGDADHHEGSLRFNEIVIGDGSPLAGRTIESVGRMTPRITFVGIRDDRGVMLMRPDMTRNLRRGDVLVMVGQPVDFATMGELLGAA